MSPLLIVRQHIELKNPVLVAGWTGMGQVALGAMNYLRKQLNAQLFAEIDLSQFLAPEAIVVEDGLAKLPQVPRGGCYYTRAPDLIILESEAQVGGRDGALLMNQVLDLAEELGVQRIYTGAAFAMPISYKEPARVFGVATTSALRDSLTQYGVEILREGYVSGLNGLLLGVAGQRGLEAACLLATLPQYAISLPNPKAAAAIIDVLEEILDFQVDHQELDEAIRVMEERMRAIEERIMELLPAMAQAGEASSLEKEEVPNYVMQKIERLFKEVEADREKAPLLKAELDRWNLYELYEDRFLDLFRKK